MTPDLSHTYSVGPITIKEDGDRFYVARSGTNRYGKAYKTLRHACSAIARELEAEYLERKNRRIAFNKKDAVKRRAA